MEHSFRLREYVQRFQDVLVEQYGTDDSPGFAAIDARFQEVRSRAGDVAMDVD